MLVNRHYRSIISELDSRTQELHSVTSEMSPAFDGSPHLVLYSYKVDQNTYRLRFPFHEDSTYTYDSRDFIEVEPDLFS